MNNSNKPAATIVPMQTMLSEDFPFPQINEQRFILGNASRKKLYTKRRIIYIMHLFSLYLQVNSFCRNDTQTAAYKAKTYGIIIHLL